MAISYLVVLGFLLLMAAQALIAVWSRRDTVGRFAVVILFVLGLVIFPSGAIELLGWHKPLWAAWRIPQESRVLAQKVIRGEGIYLYLDVGGAEPRAVRLPWSDRTAERLQKALRESARRGVRGALMRRDKSLDTNEPMFHPLPQPQLPMPKGPPPTEAPTYDRGA